jgi:hypothetical protein
MLAPAGTGSLVSGGWRVRANEHVELHRMQCGEKSGHSGPLESMHSSKDHHFNSIQAETLRHHSEEKIIGSCKTELTIYAAFIANLLITNRRDDITVHG